MKQIQRMRWVVASALTAALLLPARPAAAQNDQATDVSGSAPGSTIAGGAFSPSAPPPPATAAAAVAVSTAGQTMASSIASGSIPGFVGPTTAPAVQAVAALLTGGGGEGGQGAQAAQGETAAGGGASAATAQQAVQDNMVGTLGLPAAEVSALLTAIEGLLPSPQPAQLQQAVSAWNALCRATPPGNLSALATADAPQAIRAVLGGLVNAGNATQ
jgi:hypothetical protein